jgi:hypothetical protein
MPTTTRPTTTNVPATAPVLLKKALELPPPPFELSSAPVGLCTICVTVMTRPADVVTNSEVKEDGVAVVTEPFASVIVVTNRELAVVSDMAAEVLGVTTTVEVLRSQLGYAASSSGSTYTGPVGELDEDGVMTVVEVVGCTDD